MELEALERLSDFNLNYAKDLLEMGEDVGPIIGVWKDGRCYCWLFPRVGGREGLLDVLGPVIVGMEPDEITLAVDILHTASTTKADGSAWEVGDMQYAREHNTVDAKDVHDAIMVQVYDRLGDAACITTFYSLKDSKLTWGEKVVMDGLETRMDGYIVDVIREAFARQTLRQQMQELAKLESANPDLAEQAFPISASQALDYLEEHPQEAYAILVCTVIKNNLLPYLMGMAVAVEDPKIHEIMLRFFGEMGQVVEVDLEELDPDA